MSGAPSLFPDSRDQIDTLAYDVSYIAQRHAHALSRFVTADGRRSGHIYGVFKQIKIQVATLRPRRLAFLYDRGAPWRRELVPSYKESRRKDTVVTSLPTENDWSYQQASDWSPAPEVERLCRAMPGLHLSMDNFEADDMAAVLCDLLPLEERNGSLVFFTADHDYWQLVSDTESVMCLLSRKKAGKKSDVVWIEEAEAESAFGVPANRIAILKALTGDMSDDIRGIEGASRPGKKKLLAEFAKSDDVLSYLDHTIGSWQPTTVQMPEWLLTEVMAQRIRMQCNVQVTDLRKAAEMIKIQGVPDIVTSKGDMAEVLSTLTEFECEALMGQTESLFKSIHAASKQQ